MARSPESAPWHPQLCFRCPVPDIVTQPGSRDVALEGRVRTRWWGLRREMEVSAVCTSHLRRLKRPQRGCPDCRREDAQDGEGELPSS